MSSRVRLLPAMIGAASVLLVLRVGAIASASSQAPTAAPASAAPAPAAPATPAAAPVAIAPTASAAAPATPAPVAAPAGQAQTKGEAEVLQNLGQRRAELDARQRDLDLREQLLSATEQRVQQHLVELQALQGKLDTMLAQRDAAEEAQLASLVKTYENMKAPDAAKIFNKLDHEVLLTVAQRMKPAKIGAVLAAMDPPRAQDLTVMLAKRMSLPKPQPVVAAPATTSAAPPGPEMQPQAPLAPSAAPRG